MKTAALIGFPTLRMFTGIVVGSAIALLCFPSFVSAQCAPQRLVKVVIKNTTPGLPADSFAARPKTIYRLGDRFGRVEEEDDEKNGIHGLIVINEPNIWMVNRTSQTGRHIVDPGPTFDFHSPAVAAPGDGDEMMKIEHGCEHHYMTTHGKLTRKNALENGSKVDEYEVQILNNRVVYRFKAGTRIPVLAEVYRDTRLAYRVAYIEFSDDLPPSADLFVKPEGIAYQEAK